MCAWALANLNRENHSIQSSHSMNRADGLYFNEYKKMTDVPTIHECVYALCAGDINWINGNLTMAW